MNVDKKIGEKQHLRLVLPTLYTYITTELEALSIHSYDVLTTAVEKNNGYQITIQYGDYFSQSQSKFFTDETINLLDQPIRDFIILIGEKCRETMIADYFKMMKP